MNLLFYTERLEDAHVAHALALTLQAHFSVKNVAAITCRETREGQYLRQETNGLFRQVLSETTMHQRAVFTKPNRAFLDTLETRYGLPFWHYITHNRFLSLTRANHLYDFGTSFSRDELLAHVQVRFELIERFVEEVKPDAILYPVDVGPSSALILERVAKAKGIPVFVPISSRLGSYHTLIDTVFSKANNVEKRFAELETGATSSNLGSAKTLIKAFREGQVTLPYMQGATTDNFERKVNLQAAYGKVREIIEHRSKQLVFKEKNGEVFNLSQLEYDLHRAVLYYRNLRLRFENYFSAPRENDKFVFFPFHVEPELSLLLYAPYHTHQTSTAQNVAQSLPWDTVLYAKEHPLAVGTKPLGFYKRMKTMVNVRLIYPHVSSRSLIAASKGVVTITGTTGIEAMLLGKPVVTLGDVFYNFVPKLVQRARSVEDLPALIREFETSTPDEKLLETFVTALLDESVEVDPEQLGKVLLPLPLEKKLEHPWLHQYTKFLAQKISERHYPALLGSTTTRASQIQSHENTVKSF
jgi:hypothetical protein